MTLSEELVWRGFINQTTLTDLKQLDTQKWVFYHGFDASADSQTVGNLAAMMLDKAFMRHGHKAIILAGGATSLIGDPGGKDVERPLQDEKTVAHNVAKAEEQLKRVFTGQEFTLVNNLDWTKRLSVIEFLRDYGKHFSMTPLIQRDYIAKRLGDSGTGISYAEFSYTILQGMDYLQLFDKYNVRLQLGGSDQWGNCLSGVELVRKARGQEVHVITLPLIINKATGKKFGKSEGGAVWLDESKTSVYQFYQFWLNVDDASAGDYLKIFTELTKGEVAKVMQQFEADKGGRWAQKVLAYEVTRLVHGKARAESVKKVTNVLFGEAEFNDLTATELSILKDELTVAKASTDFADTLVRAGLAGSKTEARNFQAAGAILVNGQKVGVTQEPPLKKGANLVKRGKNSFAIIEV